jgi:hypothetical protein
MASVPSASNKILIKPVGCAQVHVVIEGWCGPTGHGQQILGLGLWWELQGNSWFWCGRHDNGWVLRARCASRAGLCSLLEDYPFQTMHV